MPTGNRLSFVSTIIPNLSLYELFRKVTTLFSYLQEFSRKVTEKVVDSLYLLQFACFIFMLVNAFFVALSLYKVPSKHIHPHLTFTFALGNKFKRIG